MRVVYKKALLYYLASSLLADCYSSVFSQRDLSFNEPSVLELELAQYEEDVLNGRVREDYRRE